ncbi:hypothetical protein JKP88DRAFT_331083, partial [Tribonema minus]
ALLGASGGPAAAAESEADLKARRRSPRPFLYRIEYTDPPTMVPYPEGTERKVEGVLASQQLVFLGAHTGSAEDGALAAGIVDRLAARKGKGKLLLGLADVQQRLQPALDAYLAASDAAAAELQLRDSGGWAEGAFEGCLPALRAARARGGGGVALVALAPDAGALARVAAAGLEGLSADERNQYVIDLKGFIEFARQTGYRAYADEVIFPAYADGVARGAFGAEPPSKANYFAARILRDEAVASAAVEAITAAPAGSTMVVLQPAEAVTAAPAGSTMVVDLDRVKFGFGSSGRAERIARSLGGALGVRAVLLNPTAADTLSGTTYLRLALGLAEDLYDGRPLADFVWYSARPLANQLSHLMNADDAGPIWARIKLGYD